MDGKPRTAPVYEARPLADVCVLELSASIAGAYAGRLFADAGARVVRVDQEGAPERSKEFDAYLHFGKETVSGDPRALPRMAAELSADVVLLELPDAPEGGLRHAFGDAVVVVITPWGLDGPWSGSGRPWSELTLQVEAGVPFTRGLPDRYPLITGSSECLWVAGSMAAGAATAALQGSRDGRIIDLSLLDVTVYATNMFQDVSTSISGAAPSGRNRLAPSVEPASDGWVGFNLASRQNHEDFLVLIERPEYLADEEMTSHVGRYRRIGEWNEAVRSWTRRHTVAEIVELAGAFRIPCAPVHDPESILTDPQVLAREFYEDHPGGGFVAPKPPFLIAGKRPARTEQHTTVSRVAATSGEDAPFAGLRVLDLGTWWVGSYVGSCLGSFGADVVKVEGPRRFDGVRTLGTPPPTTDHWWENSSFYLSINFNKRNVTIDFNQPAGRELLVRLIEQADILIENYAPRVLESAGLGWDEVHRINPRLVMLRMPAFGLTGPRRAMVGYAQTVEQFSGLCWRTGYPEGDPTNPSGPPDPMGGANAFFALAAALRGTRDTGEGVLVEAVLAEAALVMSSEQVIRRSAGEPALGRTGNRDDRVWVQGIFAARGEERWVGLTAADETRWRSLAKVAGLDRLATHADVRADADEIEAAVAAWLGTQDAEEAVDALLAEGIPAAVLTDARFVHEHPHLAGRGTYEPVELPWAGTVPLPTLPFRRAGHASWLRRRPPTLGEHNEEILVGELGLTDAQLAELSAQGVIADSLREN